MADSGQNGSFLRKMVRFVANPGTDWHNLDSVNRSDDNPDLERAELKAMIERKRRNDFVRKREFETLRRLRRDGLSPEQLAALGGSARGEDSESRMSEFTGMRADASVKAKIDEIEQQMVGDAAGRSPPPARRPVAPTTRSPVPTQPSHPYAAATTRPASQGRPLPAIDNPPTLPGLDHPLGSAAPMQASVGRGLAGGLPPLPQRGSGASDLAGSAGSAAGMTTTQPAGFVSTVPGAPFPPSGIAPHSAPAHPAAAHPAPAGSHPAGSHPAGSFPAGPYPATAQPAPAGPAGASASRKPPATLYPSASAASAAAQTGGRAPQPTGYGAPAPTRPVPFPPSATLPWPGISAFGATTDDAMALEVNEVVHDPDLDEAVIAFANADFAHCEQALAALCKRGGLRHDHAETWLVLFDLYRATGQQVKFDALALDFTTQFQTSGPQWISLPQQVAELAAEERPRLTHTPGFTDVGWVCPAVLDTEEVARLGSTALQLPLPWVLDWSAVERVEAEAATQLRTLLRQWAMQPIEMRWLSADRLIQALQEGAPTGVRDGDPAYWLARLEALRLANRPDQFDETAIDYCVTYEVSPPSWERARCTVRLSSGGTSTRPPSMSMMSEVSTTFLESAMAADDTRQPQVARVELSGQLSGDIAAMLDRLTRRLGQAPMVEVACSRLIRVDFIAAGDLLNWVLARQSETRSVTFTEAHRLVALFFGAMGINEHARVQITRQ